MLLIHAQCWYGNQHEDHFVIDKKNIKCTAQHRDWAHNFQWTTFNRDVTPVDLNKITQWSSFFLIIFFQLPGEPLSLSFNPTQDFNNYLNAETINQTVDEKKREDKQKLWEQRLLFKLNYNLLRWRMAGKIKLSTEMLKPLSGEVDVIDSKMKLVGRLETSQILPIFYHSALKVMPLHYISRWWTRRVQCGYDS